MSTPEDRAEMVNDFIIYANKVAKAPDVVELSKHVSRVVVVMRFDLVDLRLLVEELEQAKLDRAKLALHEQRAPQG